MKTIYENVIELVGQGAHFNVNFKRRSLFVNGKRVKIKNADPGIRECKDLDEWLDVVESLYDDYKYSKPTKQSTGCERHAKFKALSVSQLVDTFGHDALSNPIPRNVAQAKLEVFILLSLVHGIFKPEELFAKDWFYQGSDKSLIIRKDWF